MQITGLPSASAGVDTLLATPPTVVAGDMTAASAHSILEMSKLQNTCLIRRLSAQQWSETDGSVRACVLSYYDICSTALSIVMRAFAVYINVRLAYDYHCRGQTEYFAWTTTCIVVPMCITTLIHANMCHQDGKFNKGVFKALQTLWLVFLSSFFFRYWKSLVYAVKCKRAELDGHKEAQLKYFKLTLREESDIAFIRLFECFLEAAPQKILQISIALGQIDRMTNMQIIAICSYFGSMAWCLVAYHRSNRYAQIDKYNLGPHGLILQLCWHFCISVSRTLCIAFLVCIFPLWALSACLCHALFFGFVTFIVDRPRFVALPFLNFLFCLVLGVVYLFTFIAVKDAPTRLKYIVYYVTCSIENIACVLLFMLFASHRLVSAAFLFYPLCAMALSFYYVGIVFMAIYYLYFHPNITARKSKRIINNN